MTWWACQLKWALLYYTPSGCPQVFWPLLSRGAHHNTVWFDAVQLVFTLPSLYPPCLHHTVSHWVLSTHTRGRVILVLGGGLVLLMRIIWGSQQPIPLSRYWENDFFVRFFCSMAWSYNGICHNYNSDFCHVFFAPRLEQYRYSLSILGQAGQHPGTGHKVGFVLGRTWVWVHKAGGVKCNITIYDNCHIGGGGKMTIVIKWWSSYRRRQIVIN